METSRRVVRVFGVACSSILNSCWHTTRYASEWLVCNAGIQQQDQTCSQTASCVLTSSSTAASSPQETVLHSPLRAPAESQPCTQSQQAALSQLSTMTASGSEAVCPPQSHPQGGAQDVIQRGIQRSAQESAQTGVQGVFQRSAQESTRQGMPSTQPSNNAAAAAAAQTVQADKDVVNNLHTKAGLLVWRLLDPAAVLAMLGLSSREVLVSELQTQQQPVASENQTQAGAQLSSVDSPKVAKTGAAAVLASTEADEAAAGHPLTHDRYVGANHTARADQQQAIGKRDSGGSLLTLLGLGGVTEGLGRGPNRMTSAGPCEEKEAGLQADRQAGIASQVIETLLSAALTQPEVSGFPSLPPPPSTSPFCTIPCHHTNPPSPPPPRLSPLNNNDKLV